MSVIRERLYAHPVYYIIFIIYYSSDSPSSLITHNCTAGSWPLHTRRVSWITVKALVTFNIIQSVCLVGKGRLKERCGLEPRTFFFRLRNRQKLVRIRFENIRYYLMNSLRTHAALSLRYLLYLTLPFVQKNEITL